MLTFKYELNGIPVVHIIKEYVGKDATPENIRKAVNDKWKALQADPNVDITTLKGVIDIPGQQPLVIAPPVETEMVYYCKVKFSDNGRLFAYESDEPVPKDENTNDEYIQVVLDTPFGLEIKRPFEAGCCSRAAFKAMLKGRKSTKIKGFFFESLKGGKVA